MNTVRILFSKTGAAAYISLLDMQRVMSRAIKRSGIPAWYTLGFNPHIYMSFTCPLPLGQESMVESVDIKTEVSSPDFEGWKSALNRVMPSGLCVKNVWLAQDKAEEIAWAQYVVCSPAGGLGRAAEGYNAMKQALVEKKSKRGIKTLDLKEYIPKIDLQNSEKEDSFTLLLPAGVAFTVNPALLLGLFEREFGVHPWNVQITRTQLLTKNMKNFY